jgi:mRNA interferase HigB
VHVISKAAWRDAVAADPTLEAPLAEWHKVASSASWKNIVELRKTYPHADYVDPYTVFNIKGNTYRLIVKIEYRWQMVFVKHVLTHAEYEKGGWEK